MITNDMRLSMSCQNSSRVDYWGWITYSVYYGGHTLIWKEDSFGEVVRWESVTWILDILVQKSTQCIIGHVIGKDMTSKKS